MKKLIILLGLFAATGGVCSAQSEKGFSADVWWQLGSSSSEFAATGIAIAPTWTFNRTLFARLQLDGPIGLWNVGGQKTWQSNETLGPGFGANVCRLPSGAVLAVAAAAGRSIEKREWRYAYYDLGAELSGRGILVGFGVRRYDSIRTAFRDRTTFYMKLGWRFRYDGR